MTNIRMIFRSKWMVAGVACEILALIAAVGNWFAGSLWVWQLLPNVSLTLATSGAVLVAAKVALDYHGRPLNEEVNNTVSSSSLNATQEEEVAKSIESSGLTPRQRQEVNEISLGSDLNEIQKGAVGEIIAESGLSPRQISDLPGKLMDIYLWRMVSAQQAAITAYDHLVQKGHGRVAVLTEAGGSMIGVQRIDRPKDVLACERRHDREDGDTYTALQIAAAHLLSLAGDTVIWWPPGNNGLRYANGNTKPPIAIDGMSWVFSTEDCVPKRLDPVAGDYVLTRDPSGRYAWVRKS